MCKRSFNDQLTFCLDDGTPLSDQSDDVAGSERPVSDPSRVDSVPTPGKPEAEMMQEYGGLGSKATWSASVDQIPELQKYIASATPHAQQRKGWQWLVVALAIVILLVFIILAVTR